MSCDVGHRRSSDLVLLWLLRGLVATAPIRPLTWELPYATGAALKRQKTKKRLRLGVPVMVQWERIRLRLRVLSLASLSGLRIWHCHELWGRSQTQLGSGVAVAVA